VQALGYELFWHFSPFYNPRNYFQNPVNVFGSLVDANMIGVPPAQGHLFSQSFARVLGPDDSAAAAVARSRQR
jgi:hypothetical protein